MVSTYSGGSLRFRLKAGGSTSTLVSSAAVIQPNTWRHVAATYDGTAMRLYVDAHPVGSTAKTGVMANDPAPLALGAQPQGSNELDGLLDDVRIYDRALSQAEVAALMTPPAPALPKLRIDDVSSGEGNGGTTTPTFTVSVEAAP